MPAGAGAFSIDLGAAQDYNAFFFGNFAAPSSDVQGRVAAGGNVTLGNYSVGDQLGSASGTPSLVVGGNLSWTNGTIYYGDVVVGGNVTDMSGFGITAGDLSVGGSLNLGNGSLSGTISAGGTVTGPSYLTSKVSGTPDPVPVDFSAEKTTLSTLSNTLASLSPTGTASLQYSSIIGGGDGTSSLQVINVNGNDWSSASGWDQLNNIPDDAVVVINVSGTNLDINGGTNPFIGLGSRVIYNFYEATSLNLHDIRLDGLILAVWADITTGYGQVNGTVVANSWSGPLQINLTSFGGYDDGDPGDPGGGSETPEPGTLILLGSAGALMAWRSRRKAQAA